MNHEKNPDFSAESLPKIAAFGWDTDLESWVHILERLAPGVENVLQISQEPELRKPAFRFGDKVYEKATGKKGSLLELGERRSVSPMGTLVW